MTNKYYRIKLNYIDKLYYKIYKDIEDLKKIVKDYYTH